MATVRMRRKVTASALAVALVIGTASAAMGLFATPRPTVELKGYTWVVTSGAYRYTFDAAWRTERLRSRRTDDIAQSDLLEDRPEEAVRLRSVLLRHLGVSQLTEVPRSGATELDSLHALGYL